MSFFEEGLKFLRDSLHACASEPVRVERGGQTILESTVVFGATKFDDLDERSGRRSFSHVDDLIFRGDVGYIPKPDDVFFVGDANGAKPPRRYVTRLLNKELYRWEDSARTQLRVHAIQKDK